jgi:OOP family OmpA-OmpF porin
MFGLRGLLVPLCLAALALTGCQTARQQGVWSAAQIAVMKEEGFINTERGWEFSMDDRLLFPTDQSKVAADQSTNIARMATRLLSVGIRRATVEGHTDDTGTEQHNLTLSKNRADTVARVLQGSGYPLENVQAVGLGKAFPIESNATEDGRRENRRVVILLTSP